MYVRHINFIKIDMISILVIWYISKRAARHSKSHLHPHIYTIYLNYKLQSILPSNFCINKVHTMRDKKDPSCCQGIHNTHTNNDGSITDRKCKCNSPHKVQNTRSTIITCIDSITLCIYVLMSSTYCGYMFEITYNSIIMYTTWWTVKG